MWSSAPDFVVTHTCPSGLAASEFSSSVVPREITRDALETGHSRFLAEVTASGTTVLVEEGEVVVRSRGTSQTVKAGASVTVRAAAAAIPEPLLTPAASSSRCNSMPQGTERLSCLEAESAGAGLDAQAAIYELGVERAHAGNRDGALAAWRDSLARFAGGVLEPEVRIALMIELTQARRDADAIAAARDFEARFPDDARVGDVRSLRERLEARARP
ncbi:MAG: hypothetical protein U0228_27200 [Myxococcaceae bacterium]